MNDHDNRLGRLLIGEELITTLYRGLAAYRGEDWTDLYPTLDLAEIRAMEAKADAAIIAYADRAGTYDALRDSVQGLREAWARALGIEVPGESEG